MTISEIKTLAAVDGWVDFSGTVTEAKETKNRTQKQKLMQKLKIQDTTESIGLWAYITTPFVPNQFISGRGMLKDYEGNRYIDYAKINQSPQNTPQSTPKTLQNTHQSTNSKKEVDWDAISRGKTRCLVVCAYVQAGVEPEISQVERWVDYIMMGAPADPAITEQPSDDIPF